jgi:predicted Zn-dependent peptidase
LKGYFIRIHRLFVLALAFAVGWGVIARAQDSGYAQYLAGFEKKTIVKVLPNGLTLVVCERHEAPFFSFYTLINAGSVDDPQGESGLAHMFEHMAFKGTDEIGTANYPAEKVALSKVEIAYAAYDAEYRKRVGQDPARVEQLKKAFEDAQEAAEKYVIPNFIAQENGAVHGNATTWEDSTQYNGSMPSNRLELWAYLASAGIKHPVYREFYKERDVVQEERRLRIDSNPTGALFEQFLATAFAAHPYRVPVLGWESEISQVSATDAEAFHKKYYVPSNIVIAVVGDVKASDAMPVLTKYFGAIPAGPRPEPTTTVEPPQFAEKSLIIREPAQPLYFEGYHAPDYRDPDDSVYDAIADILSDGRTARLYKSLVRDQKIASDAYGGSGVPGDKYPGLFEFVAIPVPGHTPEEMREAIHKEIDKLKNTDVSDEELQMVKTRARVGLLNGLADNEGLARKLAEYQTRYGDWRELFRKLDRIDKVSKADVRRVANKIFVESNRTSARIEFTAPAAQGAASSGGAATAGVAPAQTAAARPTPSPARAAAPSEPWARIPIPPLRAFKPQQPKRIELANGLVIFLQEDHELPFIHGSILIRGGSRDVPAAKTGLVSLYVGTWRDSGSATTSGDTLDTQLAAKAAYIRTGGGTDNTSLSWESLKGDFDSVFASAMNLLMHPAFKADKLALAQRGLVTSISRRNDSAGGIAGRESNWLVYGKASPYVRVPEYTTVDAVTLDDLKAWHDRTVIPNGMIVSVEGDFDGAAMEAKLRQAFELLARGTVIEPVKADFPGPTSGVYFADKEGINQSTLEIVGLGTEQSNPDYYALSVMSWIFDQRVHDYVRTRLGLSYDVAGGLGTAYDHPGIFRVSGGTKSASTVAATQAMLEEIGRLKTKPPTPEEMRRVKVHLVSLFIFNHDTPGEILNDQVTLAFYGYPPDYLDKYKDGLELVTAADVSRVANKYIDVSKLAILVVGNKSQIQPALSALGKVTALDIAIPPPPGKPASGAPAAQ